jgi:hypothetical protein
MRSSKKFGWWIQIAAEVIREMMLRKMYHHHCWVCGEPFGAAACVQAYHLHDVNGMMEIFLYA